MNLLSVDEGQVSTLASSLRRFQFSFDRFDEPPLYPSSETEPALAANFFFFMVAIDHRIRRDSAQYSGIVDGIGLHGAELLWALGKRRLDLDPSFFSAKSMETIDRGRVLEAFTSPDSKSAKISGPEERASLLRDAGRVLQRRFDGSALKLVEASRGFLVAPQGNGLLEILKDFEAYRDPLSKKSFLLIKFLERRGWIHVLDPWHVHVPADNILQRLALRTGIVRVENPDLERKIRLGTPITSEEDNAVRSEVLLAFDHLGDKLPLAATHLDDILWEFGRAHCRIPTPSCDRIPDRTSERVRRLVVSGPVGECPFGHGCSAYLRPERWFLKEPAFDTLFY